MLKKLRVFCVLFVYVFSQNVHSSTVVQPMQSGYLLEYILLPHEPIIIPNVWMWPVSGSCVIKSKKPESLLTFKVLTKSGSLNGEELKKGDTASLIVHNKETFYITAQPGARVEIVNESEHEVRAYCSADS